MNEEKRPDVKERLILSCAYDQSPIARRAQIAHYSPPTRNTERAWRPNGSRRSRRIVAVVERWLRFAEVRNGYRSEDYPFGIIELIVDPKGKGVSFIAPCAVDMKQDKKTGKYRLELENFGTHPSKVMGVMRRG